jgi:hypothetical protein
MIIFFVLYRRPIPFTKRIAPDCIEPSDLIALRYVRSFALNAHENQRSFAPHLWGAAWPQLGVLALPRNRPKPAPVRSGRAPQSTQAALRQTRVRGSGAPSYSDDSSPSLVARSRSLVHRVGHIVQRQHSLRFVPVARLPMRGAAFQDRSYVRHVGIPALNLSPDRSTSASVRYSRVGSVLHPLHRYFICPAVMTLRERTRWGISRLALSSNCPIAVGTRVQVGIRADDRC